MKVYENWNYYNIKIFKSFDMSLWSINLIKAWEWLQSSIIWFHLSNIVYLDLDNMLNNLWVHGTFNLTNVCLSQLDFLYSNNNSTCIDKLSTIVSNCYEKKLTALKAVSRSAAFIKQLNFPTPSQSFNRWRLRIVNPIITSRSG